MQAPIPKDLLDFLDSSPTPWHAVENLKNLGKKHAFHSLSEKQKWSLQSQKKYMVERGGESFAAFVLPPKTPKRLRLVSSHTDSPSLKVKPDPLFQKANMLLLGVEVYGAPLLNSWLNCDLGIAGRIVYEDQAGKFKQTTIKITEPSFIIPQLAIHLDREVNDKGLILNKQSHLNVLVGLANEQVQNKDLFSRLVGFGIEGFKKLVAHDLFLFPKQKAELVGINKEWIASYRIDSLQSVYASFQAFLDSQIAHEDEILMVMYWNHEEIGSQTNTGAESTFFNQTIERILLSYGMNREDLFILLNHSYALSVDLAHGFHPNYEEKSDVNHLIKSGGGVVLKTNAQQRYATTSKGGALIEKIAESLRLPIQHYVSRNDIPCGTTIGPIHSALGGMTVADIGCSQLAMHSTRELMATQDHFQLIELLKGFFESSSLDCCIVD